MTEPKAADLAILLRQQESLREVIEAISSELELRPLLTRIVRHACDLIGAENGTIGLVDEARRLIRTEAVYKMPPDELGAATPLGVGLAGQVLQTQQPLVLNHYGEVRNPTQRSLLDFAVIGMPIFWRDRMTGFFGLGSPPPRRFSAQDVEMLAVYARHAAVAIENARLFAQQQQSLEEMRLLYRTSQRISLARDIDEVVAAYLEQVAAQGRYACSIALYDVTPQGEKTAVVVRGRWTPDDGMRLDEVRFPYTYDALDPPLDAGQTVTISDVHSDPRVSAELRRIQHNSKRPALAMVPLIVRGARIGLVILSYAEVHDWQEFDLRPYQATAAQLATAIDSRRQNLLLYERGQQLAVLEERQRLARELHDSVTQMLFSTTLIAQSIAPAWRRDAAEGERRVQRLLELSQSALAELRALLIELRPAQPEETVTAPIGIARVRQHGLPDALRAHITELMRDGLTIDLKTEGYARQPQNCEEALYRIAQEALNNVVKHARAQRVEICLRAGPEGVRLTVQDDGVGLSAARHKSSAASSNSMGMQTMRERAEALGGTLNVVSPPEGGVCVEAILPGRGEDQ